MFDFADDTAYNHEQGQRARKLFAAVVLAALDDAIADDKKYGNGPEQIARWARSRDGREVLTCAARPDARTSASAVANAGAVASAGAGIRVATPGPIRMVPLRLPGLPDASHSRRRSKPGSCQPESKRYATERTAIV